MKGLKKIIGVVEEFIENCSIIDDTAHEMSKHSEDFLKYLDMSSKLNSRCKNKFESISKANCALRDQYDIIWNMSSILLKNIIDQEAILDKINSKRLIDDKVQKKSMFRISIMRNSLEKVKSILKLIISRNNEVILNDYLLIMHNDFENEIIEKLNNFKADISVRSSEILKVSKKLLENNEGNDSLNNFESIINEKDKKSLNSLNEIINNLSDFEEMIKVNVQYFFSKMSGISINVQKLTKISGSIFDLLKKKEKLVKQNLERIPEIAVILSLEIKDYLKVQDLVDSLRNLELKDANYISIVKMMEAYINIAFDNIEKLIELNHYMVEIFDSNVVNEGQSFELVEMNTHCAKNLKLESNRIYDFILSERELINKNLKYSKIIGKNIEKIMETIP